MSKPDAQQKPGGGWVRSAGFLFVACTVIPIVIGLHVGSYYDHEVTGAMVGLGWGVILALWLVVRPLWREADNNSRRDQPK